MISQNHSKDFFVLHEAAADPGIPEKTKQMMHHKWSENVQLGSSFLTRKMDVGYKQKCLNMPNM